MASFKTPVEFRALLKERQDDFRRALVRKLLSYALGRGFRASDRADHRSDLRGRESGWRSVFERVVNVVKSYPFQHARGMKGQGAEDTSNYLVLSRASAVLQATARARGSGNK